MKIGAVLCQSPLQLINSIEYIHSELNLTLSDFEFFVDSKAGTPLEWTAVLTALACEFNIAPKQVRFPAISLKSVAASKNADFSKVVKEIVGFDYLIFGEHRSVFFKTLAKRNNSKHLVFVDDGAASLTHQTKLKHIMVRLLLNCKGYSFNGAPKSTTFFSIYDLLRRNSTVVKNSYHYIAERYHSTREAQPRAYIIGQPLEELNIVAGNGEFWSAMAQYIDSHYPELAIVYIPHRRDSDSKLAYLEAANIAISKEKLPFELQLLKHPATLIAGFYSTALATSAMLPNSKVKKTLVFNKTSAVADPKVRANIEKVLHTLQEVKNVEFV